MLLVDVQRHTMDIKCVFGKALVISWMITMGVQYSHYLLMIRLYRGNTEVLKGCSKLSLDS